MTILSQALVAVIQNVSEKRMKLYWVIIHRNPIKFRSWTCGQNKSCEKFNSSLSRLSTIISGRRMVGYIPRRGDSGASDLSDSNPHQIEKVDFKRRCAITRFLGCTEHFRFTVSKAMDWSRLSHILIKKIAVCRFLQKGPYEKTNLRVPIWNKICF